MQFTAREDIAAPLGHVFARVTDFAAFERAALRRGAEVRRLDSRTTSGAGMAWHARFSLRGRQREIETELTGYDPPNGIAVEMRSPALEGALMVDLVALSRERTRLTVSLTVKPRTLAARLMLQSLKLARGNIARRFRGRIAHFAQEIEDRFVPGV